MYNNVTYKKKPLKVESIVVGLLRTKHSYRSIMKIVKDRGFSVSLDTINNIHHQNDSRNINPSQPSVTKFKEMSIYCYIQHCTKDLYHDQQGQSANAT